MKWVFPNMFSNKIKVALNKKVKVFVVVVWLFFIFHFSFSFFQYFSFASCYVKTFYVFWEDLFFIFVFKESTLQYLKKIQVQIILFNKKVFVNIYRISNSKSPPWSLFKLCGNFFLVNVSRWLGQIFLVSTMN